MIRLCRVLLVELSSSQTNKSFYTEKQGAPTRTHPAKSHRQQRYVQQGVPRRERSVFLCWWCDEPALPAMRQTLVGLPRCSSRQGWLGRMPAPDVRWLHRDKEKCLWTFSFSSNARSFDRPTVANLGEKIKVPISYQAQGRRWFPPCTCGWWLVDGLQVSAVMRSFLLQGLLQEPFPDRFRFQSGS